MDYYGNARRLGELASQYIAVREIPAKCWGRPSSN